MPFGDGGDYLEEPLIPGVNQIKGYILAYGDTEYYYEQATEKTKESDDTLQYGEEDEEWETTPDISDIEPDNKEIAAKVLYDEIFEKEGYSYEVCYNAKGNLYIDLGSKISDEADGGTYNYRFVYDRPSKNGACELFVLYRSAQGTDDEVIVDMYAVETNTGKVVVSGKKTWSDVGTAQYREITGE